MGLVSVLVQVLIIAHVTRGLLNTARMLQQAKHGDVAVINQLWATRTTLWAALGFGLCTIYPAYLLGWWSVVGVLWGNLVFTLLQRLYADRLMNLLIKAGGFGVRM